MVAAHAWTQPHSSARIAPLEARPQFLPASAQPIAVAAYPAGVPRWVTYGGRRLRVIAVHDQETPQGVTGHQMTVELENGDCLTLLQQRGNSWYAR